MFIWNRFKKEKDASDEEMLALFKKTGDADVLGRLFDRYLHLVYGVCLKYLKNEEDARDAGMQIFEKLLKEAARHEVDRFKPWLHVLTKNYCLGLLRKRKQHDEAELRHMYYPEEDTAGVEEAEEKEAMLQQLESGLQELPPEQATCLRFFYLESKSYKDISDMTGYDLKKVKSYIQNGKRNLKIYLEKRA
ncbi:RNA polymerase sigma factor [Roseivirga sp. BDSF3-8]|uniref:RNA polymerase sigma factor n=1 Tax=Roseivirga sp. BDSF3-8 TaxID=3241598 RepID=UPI0035318E36